MDANVLTIAGEVVATAIAALLAFGPLASQTREPNELWLTGGTVYATPAAASIQDAVVRISDDRITFVGTRRQATIPRAAHIVDCSRRVIVAGLWNSHVHFMERKWTNAATTPAADLNQQLEDTFTRYGFTSVFDLSSPWNNTEALRHRIEAGELRGPTIYSTGLAMLPADARVPPDAVTNFMGWMNPVAPRIADAVTAARSTRDALDAGVDAIKFFASVPPRAHLADETIRSVVLEAHRASKPVFVHPNTAADVLQALRTDVDVIAHTTPQSGPWDETVRAEISRHDVALIPTLWIWKWYARHSRHSAQEDVVNTEVAQLRIWMAAGKRVLFGTDLGAVDADPREEFALMRQAGMTPRQILASLTTAPAAHFHRANIGRVEVGFRADLLILNSDPTMDSRALTDVGYTLIGGRVVYRGSR